nr:hypothetical protein [Angustibacter aerolatus]
MNCQFCGNQRSGQAALAEREYDDLIDFESSDRYDERQKAALAYTEAIAWRLDVGDDFWDRVRSHFTEPEPGRASAASWRSRSGSRAWIRMLDIGHQQYLPGTDAGLATAR